MVEKYIILDISSKLDCMDKREFNSSESKDYMGRPGKGPDYISGSQDQNVKQ